MHTKRKSKSKSSKIKKNKFRKTVKSKKWVTAVEAGENTLLKTGSYSAAKKRLRQQALNNAKRLFGSI